MKDNGGCSGDRLNLEFDTMDEKGTREYFITKWPYLTLGISEYEGEVSISITKSLCGST